MREGSVLQRLCDQRGRVRLLRDVQEAERERGLRAMRVRHWKTRQGRDEAYMCFPQRISREVISGLCSDSGKHLTYFAHSYDFRGDDAIAPEAWVRCETTEACLAPSRQHCKEPSSRLQQEPRCGYRDRGRDAGSGPDSICG